MKKKKLIIIIIAAVLVLAVAAGVVLFFVLGRDSDEELGEDQLQEQATEPTDPPTEPIEAPIQYQAEEQSVIALPVGSSVIVTCEVEEESGVSTYRYEGLPSTIQRVADYCYLLTAEDFGFVPVDESMLEIPLPDFLPAAQEEPVEESAPQEDTGQADADQTATDQAGTDQADADQEEIPQEGTVHLVLPVERVVQGEAEGETETLEGSWLLSLHLTWAEDHCLVTPQVMAGSIALPPTPSTPTPVPMTLMEALDHVKSLPPQQLGLEGETMEDYRIYALDGIAMVGDTPCLRLNVYGGTAQDTNAIAGQYLLSGDGLHLYQLTESGSVRQLY